MKNIMKFLINGQVVSGKDFFQFLFEQAEDVDQYLAYCDELRKENYLDNQDNIFEMVHVLSPEELKEIDLLTSYEVSS